MNAFDILMKSKNKEEIVEIDGYILVKGFDFKKEECYLLQFDGLSFPNPGESTGAAVLFSPQSKEPILEAGEYIQHATNNQAEYTGLLVGLENAKNLGIKNLLIEGDSQIVVFQAGGKWKVKNENLKHLHKKVSDLFASFDCIGIKHIYRTSNVYADALTNYVLKTKKSFINNMSD